jgi:hypothetical protein
MTDEQRPYRLPAPDLGVFGADEDGPSKSKDAATGGKDAADGKNAADGGADPAGPSHPQPTLDLGHTADTAETVGHTTNLGAAEAHSAQQAPTGRMRFQDDATQPRPPTLAEQRARQQAQEAEVERELEAEIAADRSAHRRRVMIGAGVTVGIVALIGGWYLLSRPNDVTARCTVAEGNTNGTVVQDQYCDENYVTSQGGHISNGIIFLPILGGGYSQYHYYYGGSGNIGQRVSGGSYTQPSSGTIRTNSGSTVSRGGLGVSSKTGGTGGGGSKGGSGGSGGSGGRSGGS